MLKVENTAAEEHGGDYANNWRRWLCCAADDELMLSENEDEAAFWLLVDRPEKNCDKEEVNIDDEYLNLDDYNHHQQQQRRYGDHDSVIPIQYVKDLQVHQYYFDEAFHTGHSYSTSMSHNLSTMDVGVVPESVAPRKRSVDVSSDGPNCMEMATPLTPMEREARVMRYREKKKTRKFDKTIRYASRKAYAQTRPRIKGRFVKRTTADHPQAVNQGVEHMFSTSPIADTGYGIVPTF